MELEKARWRDETRWMAAIQKRTAAAVVPARALSAMGEHAAAWLLLSGLGWTLDRSRRTEWATAGLSVVVAHATAVVVKRLVRRPRPTATRIFAPTASDLSFPSAHVASTTAMAVASMSMFGITVPASIAVAQMAGRVVLGVHYPTDVMAGAALGAVIAVGVRRTVLSAGLG